MFKWIEDYKNASSKTKSFVLNCIIYSLVIIVSVIYCYARLDFVRSYDKNKVEVESESYTDPM